MQNIPNASHIHHTTFPKIEETKSIQLNQQNLNQTQTNNDRWLTIDSNELFVIRNDSVKKAYEIMINKLNRERNNKRTNSIPVTELEESVRADYQNYKKTFNFAKDIFSEASKSKKIFALKQNKIKNKVDSMSKEVKMNQFENLSDTDFIRFYLIDLMKKKSNSVNRPQDEPLFQKANEFLQKMSQPKQ